MNTTGLRERKKTATRLALHEAAARLTREHGFEHVTVEAIADAAGVSRRTFSNYFGSKEEALLYGDAMRMRSLLEFLRAQPADKPTWTALRDTFFEVWRHHGDVREHWSAQARRARKHPSVLAHQLAMYATFERELAAELAQREGAGRYPRVLAAAYLTAVRLASQIWAEGEPTRSPEELVAEIFDEFARPFN